MQRAGIAPGDTLPLDLFCELSHVVFSPEGKARTMGDAALERVGRARRVVMTMPVFSGVYRAVAGSELIALLPHQLARQVAPAAGLDLYRVPIPVDPVEIVMIWHRRFSALRHGLNRRGGGIEFSGGGKSGRSARKRICSR